MIYLAAPYSTGLPEDQTPAQAMADRARQIDRAAARLLLAGQPVYSPVSHGKRLEIHLPADAAADHALWMGHCLQMLNHARELWVLQLPGWRESRGVQIEIDRARSLGIPITMIGADAPLLT